MRFQLSYLKLDFDFFDAVDGCALSEAEIRSVYSSELTVQLNGRDLTRGEIGCALSHIRIYEEMCKSNASDALILEDDAVVGTELVNVLQNRHRLPRDWDLINFFTDTRERAFGPRVWHVYRPTRFVRWPNRTAAYLLSKRGAEKLMSTAYPIRMPADNLTGRGYRSGLNFYGMAPRLVTLRDFGSTIVNDSAEALKWSIARREIWINKNLPRSMDGFLYRINLLP